MSGSETGGAKIFRMEDHATRVGKSLIANASTPPSKTRVASTKSSSSSGGNQGDWKASVEARLGELRSDIRNLLIGGGFVALALAGVGWNVYGKSTDQMQALAVSQKAIEGKIDNLDTKISGKIELLNQRLDDNAKSSPRK